MHPKLFVSLYEAIQVWSDQNCGSDGWPTFYWPNGGDLMLAKAVANTFDAMAESSKQAEAHAEEEASETA